MKEEVAIASLVEKVTACANMFSRGESVLASSKLVIVLDQVNVVAKEHPLLAKKLTAILPPLFAAMQREDVVAIGDGLKHELVPALRELS